MAIATATHVCSECGHSSPKWFGRCPGCGAWSTATAPERGEDVVITSLSEAVTAAERIPTGIGELDRVLGGGLVVGEAILLAGEPGIGKSTLVLDLIGALQGRGSRCLLATGEESPGQVGLRARRLGLDLSSVRTVATDSLQQVLAGSDRERPNVLVVDSIQTLADQNLEQVPGSPLQVQSCAAALVRYAKQNACVVVVVGHVTKDGSVAGPKLLEHVVDAVLGLEGERHGALRVLRASKNRFGSTEETGVFVMGERGLEPVPDPSAMLLADRHPGATGSVVFCGLEGSRPVLMEVQALVTASQLTQPRRVAIGVDARRVAMMLGVMSERAEVKLAEDDVFVAAAGGLAVKEPAADLPLCLALYSAKTQRPVPEDLVAVGEVGLAGEIRRAPGTERRLSEAARLGFTRALVPRGLERGPRGIEISVVSDLGAALTAAAP
jgi:DNA repair protein RadA/Sms